MQPLSFNQLRALPVAVDLMTAARALGLGRTKAYQLAQDGEFPCRVIKVGNTYHVPTADLLKLLGITNMKQLDAASIEESTDEEDPPTPLDGVQSC